jgi:succinate dehydrogenase/fumarate reductase flavoprotein subunit
MIKHTLKLDGLEVPVYEGNTIVVGSGAAALKCAHKLAIEGIDDIALVTSNMHNSTSYWTSSDRMTFHTTGVSGRTPDSGYSLAEVLYLGGCLDGDVALAQGDTAAQAFNELMGIGVKFPKTRHGTALGFQTDFREEKGGTSAGPFTSRSMVECLEDQVRRYDDKIEVFDKYEVISIIADNERVYGVVAIDKSQVESDNLGLCVFKGENVVLGVGGPAGLYEHSVYPKGVIGSIGMALDKGGLAANLPEGQFGISPMNPPLALSGSYGRAIPSMYSVDSEGTRYNFLDDAFATTQDIALNTFMKGNQWPFAATKINGRDSSSRIDVLTYIQTIILGRKVFWDFSKNPKGEGQFCLDDLSVVMPEFDRTPYQFLNEGNALRGTPYERLMALNPQAELPFRKLGIDISNTPIEVAVGIQHSNGGLAINEWWETSLDHLFAVGECAATNGIRRPGGTALLAGQVGGIRAAEWIGNVYNKPTVDYHDFEGKALGEVNRVYQLCTGFLENDGSQAGDVLMGIRARMSEAAGFVRGAGSVSSALAQSQSDMLNRGNRGINRRKDLPLAFATYNMAVESVARLAAIQQSIGNGVGSRGSYLVLDPNGTPIQGLGNEWNYRTPDEEHENEVQTVRISDRGPVVSTRDRRDIPKEDTTPFGVLLQEHRKGPDGTVFQRRDVD